jgi:hypothetical protein
VEVEKLSLFLEVALVLEVARELVLGLEVAERFLLEFPLDHRPDRLGSIDHPEGRV